MNILTIRGDYGSHHDIEVEQSRHIVALRVGGTLRGLKQFDCVRKAEKEIETVRSMVKEVSMQSTDAKSYYSTVSKLLKSRYK